MHHFLNPWLHLSLWRGRKSDVLMKTMVLSSQNSSTQTPLTCPMVLALLGLGHQTHPKKSPSGTFLWCLRAGSTVLMPPLMTEKWISPHYKPAGCSQQHLHLQGTMGEAGKVKVYLSLAFSEWTLYRERNVITSLYLWSRLVLQ